MMDVLDVPTPADAGALNELYRKRRSDLCGLAWVTGILIASIALPIAVNSLPFSILMSSATLPSALLMLGVVIHISVIQCRIRREKRGARL